MRNVCLRCVTHLGAAAGGRVLCVVLHAQVHAVEGRSARGQLRHYKPCQTAEGRRGTEVAADLLDKIRVRPVWQQGLWLGLGLLPLLQHQGSARFRCADRRHNRLVSEVGLEHRHLTLRQLLGLL